MHRSHYTSYLIYVGAAFILTAVVNHGATDRVGNFYRIEVNFTRFLNPQSQTYDGSYCDRLSVCDPQIYADIDLIYERRASSQVKPRRKPADFALVHTQCCADSYNMTSSNQVVRTICELGRPPLPKTVYVRVEVWDKDLFTSNDLMEQFSCKFAFQATARNTVTWSDEAACQPLHGPHQIRLYYQYRMYPIFSTECYIPF